MRSPFGDSKIKLLCLLVLMPDFSMIFCPRRTEFDRNCQFWEPQALLETLSLF